MLFQRLKYAIQSLFSRNKRTIKKGNDYISMHGIGSLLFSELQYIKLCKRYNPQNLDIQSQSLLRNSRKYASDT